MHRPTASELLVLWERACGEDSLDRALTLISACYPESRDQLAKLSIGQRDARMMRVYEALFGPAIEAFAECPQCGERLEYGLSTRELASPEPVDASISLSAEVDGTRYTLRLPDSSDLRQVSQCADEVSARKTLLQRCIVAAETTGELDRLPECAVNQIAARLAEADPNAEILIDLACCACHFNWQVVLDIERFLWVKIGAMARRLLREVHGLARAYGWREHDILALSAVRRQTYLEMAGAWPTF